MTIEAGPAELFTTLATERDVPGIVALVNSAYRGTAAKRGWTSEEHLIAGERTNAESIKAILAEPGSVILVIRGQFLLNGCVHLKREAAGLAYLGLLSVRPALQGSQYGRHLLAAAEHYARQELGCQAIEMTVINQREELVSWYERRGYERTGEVRPFPYDDASLGQPSRDDLAFVVLKRTLAG